MGAWREGLLGRRAFVTGIGAFALWLTGCGTSRNGEDEAPVNEGAVR